MKVTTKWHYGGGGVSGHLRTSTAANPPRGAVVFFHLSKLPKEVTLEVFDAKGNPVAKALGKAKPDPKPAGEDEKKDDDDPKVKRKFDLKAGLNRFVWDLTHDGADVIPGAQVDSGNPAAGIPVAPGKYTVKLTLGKDSQTTTVEVKPDPRLNGVVSLGFGPFGAQAEAIEEGKAAAQERLALKLRDNITKLSETVKQVRALQKQIGLRKELLKENDDAKSLLKDTEALAKKLSAVEEKLHNPKAKITYGIFAARGGAMLYSQLTWLLGNATDGDGPPTKAMTELAADLEKRLAEHVTEFDKLVAGDLAKLNEAAKKLGVPELYVPPAKKPKKEESAGK
jgi:hypothetical protein